MGLATVFTVVFAVEGTVQTALKRPRWELLLQLGPMFQPLIVLNQVQYRCSADALWGKS